MRREMKRRSEAEEEKRRSEAEEEKPGIPTDRKTIKNT